MEIPVFTQQEFAAIANKGDILLEHPCIVTGLVETWGSFPSWQDRNKLAELFGDQSVLADAPQGDPLVQAKLSFAEYVRYLENPDQVEEICGGHWTVGDLETYRELGLPLYSGTLPIARYPTDDNVKMVTPLLPPGIDECGEHIPFFFSFGWNRFWAFVSNERSLTNLHVDNNSSGSYLAQVAGSKRVFMFSPDDLDKVRRGQGNFVDPLNPDLEAYPDYHEATAWTGEVQEGQMVLWGPRWAHWVLTTRNSVSICYDFVTLRGLRYFVGSGEWLRTMGSACLREMRAKLDGKEVEQDSFVHDLRTRYDFDDEQVASVERAVRVAIGKTPYSDTGHLFAIAGHAAAHEVVRIMLVQAPLSPAKATTLRELDSILSSMVGLLSEPTKAASV